MKYLTAMDEKDYPIAQANAALDEKGRFTSESDLLHERRANSSWCRRKRFATWTSLPISW